MPQHTDVYQRIRSLEDATGLGVCLYDSRRFFAYHYGQLEQAYAGHYSPFCQAVRALPGGRAACIRCDVEEVWSLAQRYRQPFFNFCHAGLCEYIVPLLQAGELIGILFLGQCAAEPEVDFSAVLRNLSALHGREEEFRPLYDALPRTTRQRLSAAGALAQLAFQELIQRQRFFLPEKQPSLTELARAYIDANFMNRISLEQVSDALHVSPSYLSRCFRKSAGQTLTDYLTGVRIREAEKLLLRTRIPISHISLNVGFTEPNYFSRLFKRQTGQTPQAFRKQGASDSLTAE